MKSLCVEAKIVEYILLFGSKSAYPYILLGHGILYSNLSTT